MAYTISPNMGLVVPGVGTEYSPAWATDLNASLSSIDSHNHSSGQGVPVQPNGLDINADLSFQDNNAILLRSVRFFPQPAVLSQPTDIGCLYVVGNELYYNDVTGGHMIQLTANGVVNATSSGISSGTASAAFSAGVLVVKSSSTSGANILMQSAVLTNSGNLTNQLTVAAPALSASYQITLPALPGSTLPLVMDTSGNITTSTITYAQLATAVQQIIYTAPTVQAFYSGTGTYTTPTNPGPLYIRVRLVGGGGGGGGSGDSGDGGSGVIGGNTVFGSGFLTAFGGGPGASGVDGTGPGGGGGANGGAGSPGGIYLAGSSGNGAGISGVTGIGISGGAGGASAFGGAGGGGSATNGGIGGGGISGQPGTGGGGGGAGTGTNSGFVSGNGGGSGGYIDVIISNPLATYNYAVGAGGAGGAPGPGGAGGGSGGSGSIIVEEFYGS
jgi:hypothetical protein